MTTFQARRLQEGQGRFIAVAAYEDSSTLARVNEMCRNFARDLGPECPIINQFWLVNLLRLDQLRAMAAHDAASADLIIISFHDIDDLPTETIDWIELWLQEKQGRPGILLALPDQANERVSYATPSYLEGVAKRGNMEFFLQPWANADRQR